MKVYISGPITGIEDENRLAFKSMADTLKKLGHEPVNPHNLPHAHGKTWIEFMREDIKAMVDCDVVVFLAGFENSRGAMIEYRLALDLNMTFTQWDNLGFLDKVQ